MVLALLVSTLVLGRHPTTTTTSRPATTTIPTTTTIHTTTTTRRRAVPTTTRTTPRTVPTSTVPVTAPQTTSTSIGLPPQPTVPPTTPPRTSTSLRRASTTTRRVPIRKVADPPNNYGQAGVDTFNRWTSLLLAALVAMLSALGFLLRGAHSRRRANLTTRTRA
jgi:hypothetical protein